MCARYSRIGPNPVDRRGAEYQSIDMAVLDPDLLLRAYSIGVFPMADSRDADEIFWVEPRKRAIIPMGGFRMSRSLPKTIRSGAFTVTPDTVFAAVVHHCAERGETWLYPHIRSEKPRGGQG